MHKTAPPTRSVSFLRLGSLLVFSGWLTGPAAAQVVTFTDPGLEAAVRDTLQIQAPTNIYQADMATLTNLVASFRGIQDLGGLESAVNLVSLDLGFDQVTGFNALTGTTHLVSLDLAYNGLQSLAGLVPVPSLRELDLGGNQMTDFLALTNLTGLLELKLPSNQLHTLAGLAVVPSVRLLDVGGNQLADFSGLAGMTNLLQVLASGNQLVTLSGLEAAVALTNLDVGFNQVTNITALGGLWHMNKFQAEWNHWVDASPLSGLTNLVYLDIGGNRGALDSAVTNVAFLAGMRHLQWLSLYYLRVADLSPLTGLTMLTNLDASWNGSPANLALINGLTNLLLLHVTADTVSNIAFVSHLPRLQDLDFGYNSVPDLSPAVGRNLTSLMAYYNPLTNATLVAGFPDLARLSLGGVGLTTLTFLSGLTNLVELWVDGNPGVADVSPIIGLTNLGHLDINGDAFTNLAAITAMGNLNNLEMNGLAMLPDLSFLSTMTNLTSLDAGNNQLGSVLPFASIPQLHWLYLNPDLLTDISPLLSFPALYYVDLRGNLLNLSPDSPAWYVITNLENNYVNVDYDPQNQVSPTITIWESPADLCVSNGASAYFATSASTTAGTLRIQWQFNGSPLPGETNQVLLLSGVVSNQSGAYRAVFMDDNGAAPSADAHLYVGDPNCGRTIFIQQQPVNTVAGPGEDVSFTVAATTTLVNLYYQWQFNGTNIDGATDSELDLFGVDTNAAGFYQVLLWDDSNITNSSDSVELKVVDVVPFVDANLSSQLVQDLGLAPGSQIHLTDLDALTSLSYDITNSWSPWFGSAPITNLAGLECARNLQSLDLTGNPIGDPSPLSWIASLQYLYLDNCGLEDASFVSGLTNLLELSLNDNTIHSIPEMDRLSSLYFLAINYNGCLINLPRLAALTNLNNLGLHSDCLPDIAFCSGMAFLQVLDVGGDWQYDENRNLIADLSPLVGKTDMYWLSLSWDEATNVPIVGAFTNLTSLFLSSNNFNNLSFLTNLPLVGELAINYSGVTNLVPLADHFPLYNLDVSYIATSDLNPVAGLTNLNTLWSGGNHAGSAAFLAGLVNLQTLGCELNDVADLTPLAGMTYLRYLNLENNAISNINLLAGRPNLYYLYLSGNRIHDLSPLAGLTNLQNLSLSGNGFADVTPLANLRALNWMVMQSNQVQNVSALAGLTNLQYALDVSANEIADISPLTNLYKLTWLGPWQNQLASLPSLAGLSNLTSVDFWGNRLTNVAGVSGMPQLNWLGLSRNQLTVVQPLSDLPNLRTLDLYTNHLTDVSGVASLTGLTWLNMNDNNLQDIHPIIGLTNLIYAGLLYNLLNTNAGSAAMLDIAVLQSHGTYVDYIPQKLLFLSDPTWLGPGQFQFTIQGAAGSPLQIWASTTLTNWFSLGFITNTNGTVSFTDTSATNRVKSYRALQL